MTFTPSVAAQRGLSVVALPTDDVALLAWDPVPGVVEYRVYRGDSPDDLRLVAVVRGTIYLDESPVPGEPLYRVSPVSPSSDSNVEPAQDQGPPCVRRTQNGGVSTHIEECTSS